MGEPRVLCASTTRRTATGPRTHWGRSIFVEVAGKDCSCSVADLLVTSIPDDLTDEPFGGRHFKKGMPAEFAPEPVVVKRTVQHLI